MYNNSLLSTFKRGHGFYFDKLESSSPKNALCEIFGHGPEGLEKKSKI